MARGFVKFAIELHLFSEEDRGRRTPIQNGFRTDLKFKDEYRMVVLEFGDDLLFPGQKCQAVLSAMLYGEEEIDYLLAIKDTSIVDGPYVIGSVKVLDVIDRKGIAWKDD